MIRILFVLTLFVSFSQISLPAAFAQATVAGRVKLPPKESLVKSTKRYQNVTTSKRVGDSEPPVAVVFLESESLTANQNRPRSAAKVDLLQENYQYIPRLLPILKGTTVVFKNLDDDYHNILSYSKPKRFDLGRYRKDEPSPEVLFDKSGVVKI